MTTPSLVTSFSDCDGSVTLEVTGGADVGATDMVALEHGGAVLAWGSDTPGLAMFHGAYPAAGGVALVFDTGGVVVALVLKAQQGSSVQLLDDATGVPEIVAATADGTAWVPDSRTPCTLVTRSGGPGAMGFEVDCPRLWALTKDPGRGALDLHGVFLAWADMP